ncbi:MAG: hypothetical protein JJU45_17270 [Acidimicrobiia bacterium]|nr:hypothetical protein [Acidimicrobiia bacterium]
MADTDSDAPKVWVLVVGILVLFALVGFFVSQAQSNLGAAEAQMVVDDLCLAADQAVTDPAAALATFNGRPHNALHAIDTDLRQIDPIAASRVATAKAEAETAMLSRSPGAAELTRTLADETAAAYRILENEDGIHGCT